MILNEVNSTNRLFSLKICFKDGEIKVNIVGFIAISEDNKRKSHHKKK